MKNLLVLIGIVAICNFSMAREKKSVEALYIESPLTIDGILDEDIYNITRPAKDFMQIQPYNGQPCYQATEAFIFYDQSAIYVGVKLFDSSPDSIYNLLSGRDNLGMSDYFGVYFDPYNEGQLAYGFFITPAGVQTDIKAIKGEYDYEDGNWDAVWQSNTRITDEGWTIEMRIPYSALRFPDKAEQKWGLNMFRNIRRYNSNNSWNFIDRKVSGFIHQQGELTGIQNITPPVRLSLSPYSALYLEFDEEESTTEFAYKGGMDLKYGINESFTLDMMLIPDFGQIQSDDKRLNLSPFELYYGEKRQFFTEGTELFRRGGIFYSRRIGASPKFSGNAEDSLVANEEIDYNPSATQLLNATKISGRNSDGWGLGLLNAMTLPSHAVLKKTINPHSREILVQPFTNYNVAVVDKSLKNNSYVSIINTNMIMANNPFKANVTATEFQLRDKSKKYAISGRAGISSRGDSTIENGVFGEIELEKNSGTFTYGIEQEFYSDDYNPNDMGFMHRNNRLSTEIDLEYSIVEPFWIIREWHTGSFFEYERIYKPNDYYAGEIGLWTYVQFKNNYSSNMNFGYGAPKNDYYETRVDGRYYYQPYYYWYNFNMGSDHRKSVRGRLSFGGFNHPTTPEYGYWASTGFHIRAGQRLNIGYEIDVNNEFNDNGYVDASDNEENIYFGGRDIKMVENELDLDFALNNKISCSIRGRHYWRGVSYYKYYQLNDDGSLTADLSYSENHDINFNTFNIDMVVRWIFAPGSEITLAWKNAIFNEAEDVEYKYIKNFNDTWLAPQTNTLSIRLLYYIDYNQIRSKLL